MQSMQMVILICRKSSQHCRRPAQTRWELLTKLRNVVFLGWEQVSRYGLPRRNMETLFHHAEKELGK